MSKEIYAEGLIPYSPLQPPKKYPEKKRKYYIAKEMKSILYLRLSATPREYSDK